MVPRCEVCGRPSDGSSTGTALCVGCRARYREYRCSGCGQPGMYRVGREVERPHLADGVCGLCFIRRRVAGLTEADRAAAVGGVFAVTTFLRERLGWSFDDSVVGAKMLTGKV